LANTDAAVRQQISQPVNADAAVRQQNFQPVNTDYSILCQTMLQNKPYFQPDFSKQNNLSSKKNLKQSTLLLY
jgi:hypothetical protein